MPPPAALEGNLLLLRQGLELLDRLADPAYREAAPAQSPVGAQYRHILDHYRCLLDGIESGSIDYDRRGRDPVLETDRGAATRATRELVERLGRLGRGSLSRPLQVRQASGGSESAEAHGSSVGRELLFLVSHTVHHFAIIKLLLEAQEIWCHPDFGVAPSTLAYRQVVG